MSSEYMKFEDVVLEQEITVQIDASVRDIVSMLSIISVVQDFDGGMNNIYDQVFQQIMSYGSLVEGESNDN